MNNESSCQYCVETRSMWETTWRTWLLITAVRSNSPCYGGVCCAIWGFPAFASLSETPLLGKHLSHSDVSFVDVNTRKCWAFWQDVVGQFGNLFSFAGTSWQVAIGSGNGLASQRRQTFTWTRVNKISWRHMLLLRTRLERRRTV